MDEMHSLQPGDITDYWGKKFRWTKLHPSPETLDKFRWTYDKLADDCLQSLNAIRQQVVDDDRSKDVDLFSLLKDNASKDDNLQKLWQEIHSIPDWVDWEQIERGQEVFCRYGLANLSVLPFLSLLGGMGASRIAEVLARTGGFSPNVARRRLFETTQYVLQVTRSLDSIKPGGDGHASSVRVRLLHASVRQHITKAAQKKPNYWDAEELGIPVNDLDCILTICATVVIYLGLPRQGVCLSDQEIADYNALWRLIAHYLGTPTDPFEYPEKARSWMEALLKSEVRPSNTSRILVNNILSCLENNYPLFASRKFIAFYQVLMVGYCIFIMTFRYIHRISPNLDKDFIAIRRKRYWKLIMDGKWGLGRETRFDFKYDGGNMPENLRLIDVMDSRNEKRGIETCAYIGLAMAGVYLATIVILAFYLPAVFRKGYGMLFSLASGRFILRFEVSG